MDEVECGRYRRVDEIGQGGMGKVYRAHDSVLPRDVAIKVLPADRAEEPGYQERFRREAYTAARLNEPHIVATSGRRVQSCKARAYAISA